MKEEAMDPETGPNYLDPTPPESNSADGDSYIRRVRPSEANGFLVYTRRNKKRKTDGEGRTGNSVKPEPTACATLEGTFVISERELVEVEVTMADETTTVGSESSKRLVRWNDELRGVDDDDEGLTTVELTVLGDGQNTSEEKITANLTRPTTVRELFETGLMEGYPVFYNGGKRGFPLRGIVKDDGILCSCSLCKGNRVVPPCQFEIHACKSYRRASQYICVENGKSLLDVVKECRKSSLETLEETLYNFIGPRPIQQSVTCQKCMGSFLATSAVKVGLLCDSCMIIEYSDVDAECVKSRPLERLLGLPISENGEMKTISRKRGRPGRKKRKHLELAYNTKYTKRSSLRDSTRGKRSWIKTEILSQSAQTLKSPGSTFTTSSNSSCDPMSVDSTPFHGSQKKKTMKRILKKLSDSASVSKSLESEPNNSAKITKKDQTMHKLVFEDGGLPDGTEVAYYSFGKKLRDGYKMGPGIICHCCNVLVSPSQFEAHAGWASRKKPYMYIYTSNGVSLHEFAVSLLKGQKSAVKDSDLCAICADGGKLVLCGGCPRAFHKECASLLSIPHGKWYCIYCQNTLRKESSVEDNADVVSPGGVMDVDPAVAVRVNSRCTRNVQQREEAEVIACAICRGHDFSKSGFGPRTVILCDQCEKEFHVGCLKKCRLADLKELPKGKWFCSANCKHIYSALQDLLCSGAEKLPDAALAAIKKQQAEKHLVADSQLDVRWRLLNGKIASRESRSLLSQAVAIFHDCFDPIVDSETGRDFIPSMVYGRNIRGQDFGGIYCAILTVNSMVVSAGILRIFGEDMAELPLAATRIGNQGKGYFQVLYSCIEKLLAFLNVKNFLVPDEEKSIWTEKFGFTKIPKDQLSSYRKLCWQMINFEKTPTLGKSVPKCRIIGYDEVDTDIYLD